MQTTGATDAAPPDFGPPDGDVARGRTGATSRWALRKFAAQRDIWTSVELMNALYDRAGCRISTRTALALLRSTPTTIRLDLVDALCVALECTPNDLMGYSSTSVGHSNGSGPRPEPK